MTHIGGFETGDKSGWTQESFDNATRLVVVSGSEVGNGGPATALEGTYYLRTVTKAGDTVLGGERAEVTASASAGPSGGHNGITIWDYYALWVPNVALANFSHGELHGQWHSLSNDGTDGQANIQAIWFMKNNSGWDTVGGFTAAQPFMCVGVNGGGGTPYQQFAAATSRLYPFGASKDFLGKWVKFLWKITWGDTAAAASTELWVDDGEGWFKAVEDIGVTPNLYDPDWMSYIKLGTNRTIGGGLPDLYVYVDGEKSDTSRAAVDPGHSPVGTWTRGVSRGSGSSLSLVCTKPMDAQQGDVMYMGIAAESATSITPPAGWTLIKTQAATPQTLRVYRKVAGAGEPATYTFTQGAATVATYFGVAIAGADTTTPETASDSAANVSGVATVNAPAIANVLNGTVIDFVAQGNKTNFSFATGKHRYRALFETGTDSTGRTMAVATTHSAGGTLAARTITDINPNAVGALDQMPVISIAVAPATSGQFARPTSDITNGGWAPSTGGSLFGVIDETVVDDADYIKSPPSPPTASISEVKLGSLTDPATSTGHVIRYRYEKDQAGGDRIDLTVRLVQGTTVIATWTHADIGVTPVTAEQTLTAAQADAITDYTNLRLRFESVKV